MSYIRDPVQIFIHSYAVFKSTGPLYIARGILNLVLSLFFVKRYGAAGVFAGTLISTVVTAFFFEVFLDYFLVTFFKNNIFSILTVFNFYAYDGVKSLSSMFLFALFLASASALINYKCYKNKEMVIIESEK